MREAEELYPVETVDEIEIVFKVERFGKTYKLKHLFREPTAADKRARMNELAKTRIRSGRRREGQEVTTDYFGASLLLWDRCIKSVEGYAIKEGDQNWREKVDPDHKRIAVEKLLQMCGAELDEEEIKN